MLLSDERLWMALEWILINFLVWKFNIIIKREKLRYILCLKKIFKGMFLQVKLFSNWNYRDPQTLSTLL